MKSMKSACKASAAKKLSNMRKGYMNGGRTGYALGGDVDEDNSPLAPASMSDELGIEGVKAKKKLDKPSAKTNINIVIAGAGKSPEANPVVPPMPPIPGKPPMPPMPPMAAGPMPPMKNGGRMAFKHGGRVKCADGGVPSRGMMGTQSGSRDYTGDAKRIASGPLGEGAGKMAGEKLSKALQMKAHGGRVKHAAGGGLGRLEKAKAYGLKPAKGGK